MKKIISIGLCIAAVVCCFSSCGKSDAAKAVEAKIDEIGKITLEKGEIIADAEAAFELLGAEDGSRVKNFDILVEKRQEYDKLVAYKEKADAFVDMLDRIFTEDGITYTAVAEQLNWLNENIVASSHEAREEYDKIFSVVNEKYGEYTAAAALALASAEAYVNGFLAYKQNTQLVVREAGCIARESEGKMYFLFALSYDDNGTEKRVYSTARFADIPSIETILRYADSFYAQSPLSENSDALKNGNILLELNAD